jgi:hypothetical protein
MNDDELRDLQERVSVLSAMAEGQGWALLLDAAAASVESRQLHILRGKCESFEEYKSECAFAHGMQYLMGVPGRMQETLEFELGLRRERSAAEDLEEVM